MYPQPKIAGIAGIASGVALIGELTLFMASGWSPEAFGDPASALVVLRDGGGYLQAAAAFGVVGLAFTMIFVVGLAARLRAGTPTRATAVLYFGLIGIAGHALVPVSLWIGVPAFLAFDRQTALTGWPAFITILDGAQGIGNLFLGLSVTVTGWAVIARRALPIAVGSIGVAAGVTTVLAVAATGMPAAALPAAVFMPSLLLVIVFRIWAGNALRRTGHDEAAPVSADKAGASDVARNQAA